MARYIRYVSDIEALSRIEPRTIRNYVAAQGWREKEPYGDVGHVYAQDGYDDEIIVPVKRDFSDYALAVSKIILTLAESEERNELSIARDLSLARFDRIRVRIPEDDGNGSISLDSGAALHEQSRYMLLSAACSAHRPQRFYRLGSNRRPNDYIKKVRLGQTERGSFVVNLLSPVPARSSESYDVHTPFSENGRHDPFERRVTQNLASGLRIVREETKFAHAQNVPFARLRAGGIEHYGVSANLCEAVGELVVAGKESGVEISIDWSLAYPGNEDPLQVRFQSEDVPVLREVAGILRNQEERLGVRIEGFVSRLARDSSDREGRVILKSKIDNGERAVRVDFSPDDYNQIVDAHGRRLKISVKGNLWRTGQRWVLSNPHSVEILRRYDD